MSQAKAAFEKFSKARNRLRNPGRSSITGSGIMVPDWSSFDFDVWAPLWNNQSTAVRPLGLGGQITYGDPAPGLFAVTWIDVVNGDDPTIRNTFQVVFVGPSTSFHTNAGFAISPGSVIFSYGGPTNPSGTVNLSATSPAAIGIWNFRSQLTTLNSMGIGDSNGVLSPADVAALQNSGDPFLFNFNSGTGALDQPVAFASIPELVPEPATGWLLGVGVVGLIGLCRRPARAFDSP
jgi:PEP-CTERM motif